MMNKASLLTVGKKFHAGNLYLLTVTDLEPSGIIVQAYDQTNSKEFLLPISEMELAIAGVTRSQASLTKLISTIEIVEVDSEMVLQSSNEKISKIKKRKTGENLEAMLKVASLASNQSLNDLLVNALVELCKVKPVGLNAVKWLGEWLIENNPNCPSVETPDDN